MPLFYFPLYIHHFIGGFRIVVQNHLPTLVLHPQVHTNKRTKMKNEISIRNDQ